MSAVFEDRLNSIEARLSKIEGILGAPPPKTTIPSNDGPWAKAQSPDVNPPPVIAPRTERSGNWLGIVAVICFVWAGGFIIKLSIELGWLTPVRQIGLAALLGISLIGAGFALKKSDHEYAGLLPSAGIIVLYLATFAAHRYYFLIPFETAIVLVSLVSAICIGLYTQIRHDIYAVLAASGAYLSPLMFDLNTSAEFSLFYFLLCSVAFAIISIWVQSRTLTLVSSYLAIFMTASVGLTINQDFLVATILALHFLFFSGGTYLYSTLNQSPLTVRESWSFLPVLLVFYLAEYYFIENIRPNLAPWISLGFSGILLGLYLSAKKYFPDGLGSQSLVSAFVTLVCFHSVYIELLPAHARSWLFVIIMLGFAFSPFSFNTKKPSGPLYIPFIAVLAILAIEYVTILFYLSDTRQASWLVASLAAVVSVWCVIIRKSDQLKQQEKYGYALLIVAHLLAITGLYRLAVDSGSLAVSASWLFYAVSVMIFAFRRKDEIMAKSALFVLAFAAGKALLYDAASAPTVLRIGCLLLTGAVLYGCGLLMRKIADWKVQI